MEHGQENKAPLQNPENSGEPVKKIKVMRAKDFGSAPFDEDPFALLEEANKKKKEEKTELLPYTPFDPKTELGKIWELSPTREDLEREKSLSADERKKLRAERAAKKKEQFKNFKEKLIYQKEGVAKTTEELFKTVESAPDTTPEDLWAKVQKKAPEYKFSPDQINSFKTAVMDYLKKHAAVERFRALYPDDAVLFEACFGKKPQWKVEVVKGPMTLFFRCYDSRDYILIFTFPKYLGDETQIKTADADRANLSAGAAINNAKAAELAGTITAENVWTNLSPRYEMVGDHRSPVLNKKASEQVRIHEDQHQFNKLFMPLMMDEDISLMMERAAESGKTPEESVKNLIHGFVRLGRKLVGIDSSARDEILAYYKGGRKLEEIFKTLDESKLYDYTELYKTEIDKIPAWAKDTIRREVSEVFYVNNKGGRAIAAEAEVLQIEESEVQPYIDLVFKHEYKEELVEWLNSIRALEKKGYTKDEIISLLYSDPINSWPKLAWVSAGSREKLGGRMPSKQKNLNSGKWPDPKLIFKI